jgi:hypothetical protein
VAVVTRTRRHAIEWLTLVQASGDIREADLQVGVSSLGYKALCVTHVWPGRYDVPELYGMRIDALEAAARLREGRKLDRRTGEWT